MSRRTEAKQARRKRRRAAQDANWIPQDVLDDVVDNLDLADELERFDDRITERGWTFDDENSNDKGVAWFYERSADGAQGDGPLTTIWLSAEDNAEFVYLLLIGTTDGYRFDPEALFDHLDTIEAYRFGDPLPEF